MSHTHTYIYIHTAVCNIEGHTHTYIYIYSLDTLPYVYMGWIENKVPLNPVVYHML